MTVYGPDAEKMRKLFLPSQIPVPIYLPPVVRGGITAPVFGVTYLSLQSWNISLIQTPLKEGNFPGVY